MSWYRQSKRIKRNLNITNRPSCWSKPEAYLATGLWWNQVGTGSSEVAAKACLVVIYWKAEYGGWGQSGYEECIGTRHAEGCFKKRHRTIASLLKDTLRDKCMSILKELLLIKRIICIHSLSILIPNVCRLFQNTPRAISQAYWIASTE